MMFHPSLPLPIILSRRLRPWSRAMVTNSIAQLYMRISVVYSGIWGMVIMAKENSPAGRMPKRFLMVVAP